MPHMGTLRNFRFPSDVDDIRGANLYGRDGEKLGSVADLIFDHQTGRISYLVIDTGGWLGSTKFPVPVDRINATSTDAHDFTCNLTKEQIENFPEYSDQLVETHGDWTDYESRYSRALSSSGDVLHSENSANVITPDPSEMPAAAPSAASESGIDFTPQRIADKFSSPEPRAEKTRMRPAGIAARAEDSSVPGNALGNESAGWEESAGDREYGKQTVEPKHDVDAEVASFSQREDMGDVDVHSGPGVIRAESEGYGDTSKMAAPPLDLQEPPAYREHINNDLPNATGPYPVAYGSRRLNDFEKKLKENRVDITASCRQCGVEKEKKVA